MGEKRGLLTRFLLRDNRSDGRLVENLDVTQKIVPYFMKSRHASSIQVKETFDITRTLKYITQHNNGEEKRYSIFTIFLAALVRTGVLHPKLNRFVVGKKIYARKKLQVSFTMKQQLTDEGKEVVLKLTFNPQDTLADVASKLNSAITKGRQDKENDSNQLITSMLSLPSFLLTLIFNVEKYLDHWGMLPATLIEADPLFSSVFVANLGSLKLGAPYHPLYERGTISFFVVLGTYKKAELTNEEGLPSVRDVVDVAFTIDSRIAGGYAIAQALHSFKELIENPERLERDKVG